MKISKLVIFTIAFIFYNNANASLIILSSSESGASVSSVSPGLITGSGSSSIEFLGMTQYYEAYESYFTVNFDVIGSQLITIDASLYSTGGTYGNQSAISIRNQDSGVYELGAISQAEDSTIAGDPWVTDYAVGSLNITREIFLSEGNYSLSAGAYEDTNNSDAYGGASYSFTVTAVPVPSAFWLFGSGLIALISIKRKKTLSTN